MADYLFTNGVIAVKEKDLLKDKILRLCEAKRDDALRMLTESGFGSGADPAEGVEALVVKEELALDAFIREYAPRAAEAEYFLTPRDFHNAKALVKAEYLHTSAEKMLAPEGLYPVSDMAVKIKNGEYNAFSPELNGSLREAAALLSREGAASGAALGGIFERGLYRRLAAVCKPNAFLKRLIAQRADMTNLLTAFRSSSREYAEGAYVSGGRLKKEELARVFEKDAERVARAFSRTPYASFCQSCLSAKGEGKPFTEAEKTLSSLEADFFAARQYETEGNLPFLRYVFRRRKEIENVRMIFVCLSAGMNAEDIKKRLRAV